MRITGNTVVRRYMQNLERNFADKNQTENKISSNRKYTRASQNPIDAAKALKVRKSIEELNTYQYNLNTAKSIYESAESAVMKISELIQSTYEKLIYGANGTQGSTEEAIIGETIRTYADEMVRLLNITVADRTIFGGTLNKSLPFELRDDKIYYNGVHVNEFDDPSLFPYGGSSYTDIGIGMFIGSDGKVDQQSALPVTFNGVAIMGCGLQSKAITFDLESVYNGGEYSIDVYLGNQKRTVIFEGGGNAEETADNINMALEEVFGYNQILIDEKSGLIFSNVLGNPKLTVVNTPPLDENHPNYVEYDQLYIETIPTGFSNNIIQLTLDAAACLASGDKLGAAKFADALYAIQTNLSMTIADIGNKQEFIDFNLERTTNNLFTMYEQQNDLEGADLGREITTWKVMEAVYNAALQMSASTVPMTIFNFMK